MGYTLNQPRKFDPIIFSRLGMSQTKLQFDSINDRSEVIHIEINEKINTFRKLHKTKTKTLDLELIQRSAHSLQATN